MMKKKITAAVFVGALALTGCAPFEEGYQEGYGSSGASANTEYSSQETAGSVPDEDEFYSSLQDSPELYDMPPKSEALEFAELTCEGLETFTFEEVFVASLHAGYSGKTTGALLSWSVISFCPEYEDEMMEWARNGYY